MLVNGETTKESVKVLTYTQMGTSMLVNLTITHLKAKALSHT